MKKRLTRLWCRLSGHIMETKAFAARGRRIEIASCLRCGYVDPSTSRISARNRQLRRRAARTVAKELSR